eukprot:scaffold307_cov162-Amphora_coffeaeformis.AAC.5
MNDLLRLVRHTSHISRSAGFATPDATNQSSLLLISFLALGSCFSPPFRTSILPSFVRKRQQQQQQHPPGRRGRGRGAGERQPEPFSPILTTTTTASSPSTTTTEGPSTSSLEYSWKDQWYALTFASYVPNPSESAEATPASVFGHPLVLWRSQDKGRIYCADDVCPHRAAALSEGRLWDGKLECNYHGWQFNGDDGKCVTIPQLAEGASIPQRACLRMRECQVVEGIVWAWMGDDSSLPTKDPPRQDDGLDEDTGQRKGCILNDFQIDLPYDHSYLVENLIDPAHIPISHDRTPGGGKRENAEAYEMILDNDSMNSQGFTGRFRVESKKPDGLWTELRYDAPGVVRQYGTNPNITFGAALHCMPLSLGRSRLLFRVYFGGLPWFLMTMLQMKPKFLRDLNSCKILEQDVGLITTQEDHFARNPERSLEDDFLLLGSSDTFVGAYRRWLDMVGAGMPWFQGLASRSANMRTTPTSGAGNELAPALDPAHHRSSGQDNVETRYHRHVMHCPTTRKALERVQFFKQLSLVAAITCGSIVAGMIPFAGLLQISWRGQNMFRGFLMMGIPLFSTFFLGLRRFERAFFMSFKRKDQLRKEKGA